MTFSGTRHRREFQSHANAINEAMELPKDDALSTGGNVPSTLNQLKDSLRLLQDQVHDLSSACAIEHEKWRSNSTYDNYEIVAIAMKEIQAKSWEIEKLRQANQFLRGCTPNVHPREGLQGQSSQFEFLIRENQILKSRIAELESMQTKPANASEMIDKDASITEARPVSQQEKQMENLQPDNFPNPNGKRPLVCENGAIPKNAAKIGFQNDHIQNSASPKAGNSEPSLSLRKANGEVPETSDFDELTESSKEASGVQPNILEGQPTPRSKDTVPEEPLNESIVRRQPTTRRRGRRTRLTVKKTHQSKKRRSSNIYPTSTAEQQLSQETNPATATNDPNSTHQQLIDTQPDVGKHIGVRSRRSRSNIAQKTITDELELYVSDNNAEKPIQNDEKSKRPRELIPTQPRIEIPTHSEKQSAPLVDDSLATHTIPNTSQNDSQAAEETGSKYEEDAEKRRKSIIAAREMLVQVAMRREEGDLPTN